jgi:Flp pilus assembly protein TadG
MVDSDIPKEVKMNRRRAGSVVPERRGATTVFVAVFTLVIVGVVAFTIDLSRLFTGASELQTVSDAAALRGAQELQRAPGVSPVTVTTSFSAQNEALGAKEAVPAAAITPVFWDPTAADPETPTTWANANAVAVRASRTSRLLFGRLLSPSLPTTSQRAIAWVANVQSVSCPAPWGFPMQALNDALYGLQDVSVRATMYSTLTQKLANPGALSVTMIVYPSSLTRPTVAGESWPFSGINDAGSVNMNEYADQVANTGTCAANSNTRIDDVEAFPGNGQGSVPQKTAGGAYGAGITGGIGFCAAPLGNGNNGQGQGQGQGRGQGQNGQPRADCYPVGSYNVGSSGVLRYVSWFGPVTNNSATVLTLSGFMVMCVFNGKSNGEPDPQERCAWYDSYRTSQFAPNGLPNSLPPGTIVGYPMPTSPSIGGATLGNTPSLAQRLILVR